MGEGTQPQGRHLCLGRLAGILDRHRGRPLQGRQRPQSDRVLAEQAGHQPGAYVRAWTGSRRPAAAHLPQGTSARRGDQHGPQEGANVRLQPRQGQRPTREVGLPERIHDDAQRPDRVRGVLAPVAGPRPGRGQDRYHHQSEHHAGPATLPGDPRPQAEPRHPGARAGAGLAAPDAVPRSSLHERARGSRVRELGQLQERHGRQADSPGLDGRSKGRRAQCAQGDADRLQRRSLHPGVHVPRGLGSQVGLGVQVVPRALLLQPDLAPASDRQVDRR
jgi:hypothetical protein